MAARICFSSGLSNGLIGADQLSRGARLSPHPAVTFFGSLQRESSTSSGPQSFPGWDPGRSSHRGLASPCGATSSERTSARRYAGSWLSSAGSHPVDRGGSIRQGRAAGLVRRGVSNFSRVGEESLTLGVAKHVDPIGPGTGSFLAADHNQSVALVGLVVLHLLTVLRPTGRTSFR
jgi:hypothetical protein